LFREREGKPDCFWTKPRLSRAAIRDGKRKGGGKKSETHFNLATEGKKSTAAKPLSPISPTQPPHWRNKGKSDQRKKKKIPPRHRFQICEGGGLGKRKRRNLPVPGFPISLHSIRGERRGGRGGEGGLAGKKGGEVVVSGGGNSSFISFFLPGSAPGWRGKKPRRKKKKGEKDVGDQA